ncbi:MAG: hypothetical protein KKC20_09595 [Proteobacteria bacterium]|nr:hypothetical protein [Pseudomonadota bacterium]
MDYQLNASHPDYIQIVVTRVVEKTGLAHAMSAVFQHPEYPFKHSLWDFSAATGMGLNIGDLREIIGTLRLFRPRDNNFANKVALVVPNHMHRAMAGIFVSLATLLPFEYKLFKTNGAAIKFLCPTIPQPD